MMGVKELSKNVGKDAFYDICDSSGLMTINITIMDAREIFGRVDYFISPHAGTGGIWVSEKAIEIKEYE